MIEAENLEKAKSAFARCIRGESPIAVLGLCYEGGLLLEALSRHYPVVGYDINEEQIQNLKVGFSGKAKNELAVVATPEDMNGTEVFILMSCFDGLKERKRLKSYIEMLAKRLKPGNCVIFGPELSPELLDEFCLPLLESGSQLQVNRDFFIGFHPTVELNQADLASLSERVKLSNNSLGREIYEVFCRLKEYGDYAPLIINTGECSEEELKVKEAIRKEWLPILEDMSAPLFRRFMIACIKTNLLDNYPNLLFPEEKKVDYNRFYRLAKELGLSHRFDCKDSLTPAGDEKGKIYQGCTARGENVQPPFSEEVDLVYRG